MERKSVHTGEIFVDGGDAVLEAFQNQPRVGGEDRALGAVMARGGAAFDGILEFLAARPAGARTLAGGEWGGHGKFKSYLVMRNFGYCPHT